MKLYKIIWFLGVSLLIIDASGQDFYFGHDLSYANQMEDCGAIYKAGGDQEDVYAIFAEHGTNLVRARLWVDPSWWQDPLDQPEGVKPHYSDLEDVIETFKRSKDEGMQLLLDIHYSDFWADPGRQLIPRSWLGVAYSTADLADSVYNYTIRVLTRLEAEGIMPDLIQVGNEVNGGILRHIPADNGFDIKSTINRDWSQYAELFNAGISAIREIGSQASVNPKIVIHFTNRLSGHIWNFSNIISNGVTDFDIMAISYYYAYHGGSISELESTIKKLVQTFPAYDVMVAETGYLWTLQNFDSQGNIINEPDPYYLPVSPVKQLEYMVDYARAVKRAGGIGVVYWEPAWVSTPCATPWGVGSSYEHAVFFDPYQENFMENGGGNWCDSSYYENLDGLKVTFIADSSGSGTAEGLYISGSWMDNPAAIKPMADDGTGLFRYLAFLPEGTSGTYQFYSGSTPESAESLPEMCRDPETGGRPFQVGTHDTIIAFGWESCDPLDAGPSYVTFKVQMPPDADLSRGVYIVGEITEWKITQLSQESAHVFYKTLQLHPGPDTLAYYYMTNSNWTGHPQYRETVPAECALRYGSDRGIVVPRKDTVAAVKWGSCDLITSDKDPFFFLSEKSEFMLYPNPASGQVFLETKFDLTADAIQIFEASGKRINVPVTREGNRLISMDISQLGQGMYIIRILNKESHLTGQLFVSN